MSSIDSPTVTRLAFGCLLGGIFASALTGCVVSTHGAPGTPPTVALPDEPEPTTQVVKAGPVQIGASHVLVSYKGSERAAPYIERSKQEALQLAEQIRSRAAAGEDFGKLASEFSDDRGSAASGGSLGLFRRDQMVPTFSEAAFALEIGEVSRVVESPFGYHVIVRTQ